MKAVRVHPSFSAEEVESLLAAIARIKKSSIDFALTAFGQNKMERPLWDIAFQTYYRNHRLSEKQREYVLRTINTKKYQPISFAIRQEMQNAA